MSSAKLILLFNSPGCNWQRYVKIWLGVSIKYSSKSCWTIWPRNQLDGQLFCWTKANGRNNYLCSIFDITRNLIKSISPANCDFPWQLDDVTSDRKKVVSRNQDFADQYVSRLFQRIWFPPCTWLLFLGQRVVLNHGWKVAWCLTLSAYPGNPNWKSFQICNSSVRYVMKKKQSHWKKCKACWAI